MMFFKVDETCELEGLRPCVYIVRNSLTGTPFYVGKTVNLKKRVYSHNYRARAGYKNKFYNFVRQIKLDGGVSIISPESHCLMFTDDELSTLETVLITEYRKYFMLENATTFSYGFNAQSAQYAANKFREKIISEYNPQIFKVVEDLNSKRMCPNKIASYLTEFVGPNGGTIDATRVRFIHKHLNLPIYKKDGTVNA